jgi:hypothetical protein
MKRLVLVALGGAFTVTLVGAGLDFIGSHVAVAMYLVLLALAGAASICVAENAGSRKVGSSGAFLGVPSQQRGVR